MKVGDYVRTKDGFIAKLIEIDDVYYHFDDAVRTFFGERHCILWDTIIDNIIKKTSPNLIDLIEVGDYVNGYLVTTGNQGVGSIYIDKLDNHKLPIKLYEKEIKSIVTKEQFESMEYKIK